MKTDDISKRMKKYEFATRSFLTERMPVIIRLDGKAFHTFTKGFNRPFDEILRRTMVKTAEYLCANIMNCKLAYTQSDEISLLLINYEKIDTDSWYQNNLQKLVSVSASMATLAFNYWFEKIVGEEFNCNDWERLPYWNNKFDNGEGYFKLALFDSRAFVIPKEEVCNYFIWRQEDCTKNSINMVAQSEFPHGELQHLNTNQLQEKLFQEKSINWNNFPTVNKRGSCITRIAYDKNGVERHKWAEDTNIPIFTKDRNYIERFVFIGE